MGLNQLCIDPHLSGFHALTQELSNGVFWVQDDSKERLIGTLQDMFPTSAKEEVDRLKSVTESYHKYKREYVKHLYFNPDNGNLSKCFLTLG